MKLLYPCKTMNISQTYKGNFSHEPNRTGNPADYPIDEAGATNYQHPANHAPSIITQDASNRFVTDAEKIAWDGKASFKSGSDTFPAGTTHTVTDAFITASTLVTVSPTAEKQGAWTVDSADGSFTITSDTTETTGVTFDWGAVK